MESLPDLELAAIERDGENLRVEVTIVPPKGDGESDLVNQSLLIRITDEEDTPDSVTAEFSRE